MADFFASRPIEDFFINPTLTQNHRRAFAEFLPMDDAHVYSLALHQYHHARRASSSKEIGLKQFALPVSNFSRPDRLSKTWRGYTSDEEELSPVDHDSSSSHSDDAISVASDLSTPDQLASNYHADEYTCSQARVVKFQRVRAKMISLPKLITSPAHSTGTRSANQSTRGSRRDSEASSRGESEGRSARTSHDSSSSNESITSSSGASPTSTAPSSTDEWSEHTPQLRHKKAMHRHVPLMEAARALPPASPVFPPSADPRRRSSAVTIDQPPPPHQLRRVSKISLHRAYTLGKNLVRKDDSLDLDRIQETERPAAPAIPARGQHPSRAASNSKAKLVARGASERQPSITLPPCPS